MAKINSSTTPTIDTIRSRSIERFMGKVERIPMTDCWLWAGAARPNGYGIFFLNGKTIGAHRAAYVLFRGQFDEALHVCHKCDNPSCVNPDHLFLGTQKDNMLDMVRKGRKVTPPQRGKNNHHYGKFHSEETKRLIGQRSRERNQGSKHPRASIDEDDVRMIRRIRIETGASPRVISQQTGFSFSIVSGIVYGYSWKHVK